MVDILQCCSMQSTNQPYIGVDEKCQQAAIFCIQHNPHKNSQGLMHQMLPLKHFKKTLMQKKFHMGQKIGVLIDQYNNLMDSLIEQIRELKLRKNIQFSMLWLRQLAKDEQQYELMRQIYRMDFKDLTCSLVHSIYFKIVHNQILEKKNVNEINCYKGIAQILNHLSQQKQARSFLSKKIAQIEGILENGEILKRALPDKVVLKQNIKEVLLESSHVQFMDIKYNKCKLTKGSRQYLSIFSKYPIVPHVLYHINFQTKYTNVMLGVCTQSMVLKSKGQPSDIQINESQYSSVVESFTEYDKHYSKDSVVFNCTNGCVYKDGMFQSGSSALTKGQKQFVLKMRVTSTNQLIIMLGKNILCRQNIDNLLQRNQGQNTKLYLHALLRTEGDSFDVDRDKDITGDQLPPKVMTKIQQKQDIQYQYQTFNPRDKVNFEEIKRRNQQDTINVNNLMEEIVTQKGKNIEDLNNNSGSQSSFIDLSHLNSNLNLKSTNVMDIASAKSIKKQPFEQKSYKNVIANQIKNIQKKYNSQFNSQNVQKKIDLKKLNDNEKDVKINEIIKKERIDKILNEIKSKPFTNMDDNSQSSLASRKLKQFQQRKNSNVNINVLNRIKQARNKIQLEQFEASERNMLQPDHSALNISMSSYQTSEYNLNSPLIKSSDLKPLLMMNRGQQRFDLSSPKQSSNNMTDSGKGKFSPSKINIPIEEQQYKIGRIHPSQKIFNLGQLDSSQYENSMSQQSFQPSLGGGITPIDRIKEFQFAKRSLTMKNSYINNDGNKVVNEIESTKKQVVKRAIALPTLRESQENLDHSGAFNDRMSHESQVIESFDAQYFNNNLSPKQNLQDKNRQQSLIPTLNRSRFSKIESKSYLANSNLQSSFGGQNAIKNKPIKIMDDNNIRQTPKATMQNSIVDMGSEFRSENSLHNSIHIGHIISPRKTIKKFKQDSPIDESYDMNQLDEEQCESVIDIRGSQV